MKGVSQFPKKGQKRIRARVMRVVRFVGTVSTKRFLLIALYRSYVKEGNKNGDSQITSCKKNTKDSMKEKE